MMYCEKCNFATDENRCPLCGNKGLRAVNDKDFCFFTIVDEFHFNMLESTLKENKVEIIGVPCYSRGVTYATAGRADRRKVYVHYKDMERAKEIYEDIFGKNH